MTAEQVLYIGHSNEFTLEVLGRPLAPDMVLEPLVDDDQRARQQLSRARLVVVAEKPFTADQVEQADQLEVVIALGVGLDKIDVAAIEARGLRVQTTPEGMPEAVAEHTVLLLLAACRNLSALDRAVRNGAWPKWEYRSRTRTLAGSRVGIAGFGRIGRAVATRLAPFGARLEAFDHLGGVRPLAGQQVRVVASLVELAERCDILTLHLPLLPATERIVDRAVLRALGPHGILVNTARGGLVDEPALVEALREGTIAAAALDVLTQEPPEADHVLRSCPTVTITPHVATATAQALQAKARAIADRLRAARAARALRAPSGEESP